MTQVSEAWDSYYAAITRLRHIYQTIVNACETRMASIIDNEHNYEVACDNYINSLPEEIATVIKNPPMSASRSDSGSRYVMYDMTIFRSNPELDSIYQNALEKLNSMNEEKGNINFQIYDTYYNTIVGLPNLFTSVEKEVSRLFSEAKHATKCYFESCAEKEISELRIPTYLQDMYIKSINSRIINNTNTFITIKCSESPDTNIGNIDDIPDFVYF